MVFSFLKKQFVDVIDWTEVDDETLAFRFPMQDQEIQNGGQLTVRETQMALFVNEGEIADLFPPGLHKLTTRTLPLLTSLKNWDKAFASPFKSDVYFFSTRPRIDRKWGSPQPVTVKDRDYGPIRVRAFANYTYVIKSPQVFFRKVSGTRETYTTEDLEGQLRAVITANFAHAFANSALSFLDMAANQVAFSQKMQEALQPAFGELGLKLDSFNLLNVSLPEELQEHFDRASSMRIVGDLDQYAKFQTADSISTAAQQSGGVAGAAAGAAAGLAVGQTMLGSLGGHGRSDSNSDETLQQIEKVHELMKKGIITQAEFETKKAELLKKIR